MITQNCSVQFDYEQAASDQLSFQTGDIIELAVDSAWYEYNHLIFFNSSSCALNLLSKSFYLLPKF